MRVRKSLVGCLPHRSYCEDVPLLAAFEMPHDEEFQQGSAPPEPASEAGPVIRDDCRAARIDEVTQFAECQVKTDASCPHRLTFSAYLYCVHPDREAIIARTLAQQEPPGK